MKKETLTFPDYTSMWSFKEKTRAINIRIEARKNRITGLFNATEVDMALNEFHAVNTYTPEIETYNKANDRTTVHINLNFKGLMNRMSLVLKTVFLYS